MTIVRDFVGRLAADLTEMFVYGLSVEEGAVVYLDMAGIGPALDAVYMRLVMRGEELFVVPDNGDAIAVRTHGQYSRSMSKLGRQYNMILQRRPDLVRGYFTVMEGSPVPYLLAGAKAASAVPIRKDWAQWLFEAASDADATLPVAEEQGKPSPTPAAAKLSGLPMCCPCQSWGGVLVFSYSANPADWESLITLGIKGGKISF